MPASFSFARIDWKLLPRRQACCTTRVSPQASDSAMPPPSVKRPTTVQSALPQRTFLPTSRPSYCLTTPSPTMTSLVPSLNMRPSTSLKLLRTCGAICAHAAQRQIGAGVLAAHAAVDQHVELGRQDRLSCRLRVALDAGRIANYRDRVGAEAARQLVGGAGAHDDGHVVGAGTFERHLEARGDRQQRHQHQRDAADTEHRDQDEDQRCGMLRRFMPVTAAICEKVLAMLIPQMSSDRRSASTIFRRIAVSAGHRPVTRPNTSISDAPTTKVPALDVGTTGSNP